MNGNVDYCNFQHNIDCCFIYLTILYYIMYLPTYLYQYIIYVYVANLRYGISVSI